jgi:hypothetical protein
MLLTLSFLHSIVGFTAWSSLREPSQVSARIPLAESCRTFLLTPTATFIATGFLPSGKHLLGLRRGRDEETHLQGRNSGGLLRVMCWYS